MYLQEFLCLSNFYWYWFLSEDLKVFDELLRRYLRSLPSDLRPTVPPVSPTPDPFSNVERSRSYFPLSVPVVVRLRPFSQPPVPSPVCALKVKSSLGDPSPKTSSPELSFSGSSSPFEGLWTPFLFLYLQLNCTKTLTGRGFSSTVHPRTVPTSGSVSEETSHPGRDFSCLSVSIPRYPETVFRDRGDLTTRGRG